MTYGFPKNLLTALICQRDGVALLARIDSSTADGSIVTGVLSCPECGAEYAITDGIVDFLSGQANLEKEKINEIKARNEQAENYNKKLAVRYYKEVRPTIREFGLIKNKKIIEYGCGTGRFTLEFKAACSQILGVDFSRDSLKELAKNLTTDKVGLVLADATRIKTASCYFDKALATQFLEHVPSYEQRQNFLKHVRRTLKDGSVFVVTVYHHDLRRQFRRSAQEGFHANGIFYHYFTASELKQEFKKYFKNIKIYPIDVTLPFEVRLKLPQKIGGLISRLTSHLYLINRLGHLLLIKSVTSRGYRLPGLFFKKYWFWFADPIDMQEADMVNFFSYNKVDLEGFHRKAGLTSVIDLKQDLDTIWLGVRKKFTADLIKKGERLGIIVKQDDNFSGFKKIYKKFREKKKINIDKFKVFHNGILFSAYYQGNLIANHLFVADDKSTRSWVAASKHLELMSGKDKRIVGYANRQLIWQAIKFFKNNGFERFDLGGINPSSAKKDDITLAEFKESFGGRRQTAYFYSKVYSKLLRVLIKLKG